MTATTAARPPRPPHTTRPPRTRRLLFGNRPTRNPLLRAIASHSVMIMALVLMLYPLLWMVGASFRPDNQVFTTLGLWTGDVTTENYTNGWGGGDQLNFSRFFLNSLTLTVLSIVGNLISCSLTAYAFARLEFRFKRTLFALVIGTLLLPYHVTLVPQYILFNQLGWVNTFLPLVVPKIMATDAFFIFLMVQFIRALPTSLDDAARIDGCGHWGIFRRVVVPLSIPALGTTALFTFINTWNDFLGPMLYLTEPDTWTVSQGLASFLDATGQSEYGSLFAMSTLSLVPVVGFFIAAQRLLIEGIATTGLK
ncbi:carbohydrate ABC transporter permease [Streptomyces radicis]|uniref:Carbohydrate ABC transporter permease n=1 Tax=Streptomyces radicis TaxID=1750517 RepID=A0A3A9WIM8_9ACTN|nr:carbohydrate ABC transporter permease [Streptomyces radicis]RKN07566.1 carbohydrate ABC transporter permease [Streptomyces radicis]RKN13697.1 carbohydrate ABC transporter permease [Streptomyces radicis]